MGDVKLGGYRAANGGTPPHLIVEGAERDLWEIATACGVGPVRIEPAVAVAVSVFVAEPPTTPAGGHTLTIEYNGGITEEDAEGVADAFRDIITRSGGDIRVETRRATTPSMLPPIANRPTQAARDLAANIAKHVAMVPRGDPATLESVVDRMGVAIDMHTRSTVDGVVFRQNPDDREDACVTVPVGDRFVAIVPYDPQDDETEARHVAEQIRSALAVQTTTTETCARGHVRVLPVVDGDVVRGACPDCVLPYLDDERARVQSLKRVLADLGQTSDAIHGPSWDVFVDVLTERLKQRAKWDDGHDDDHARGEIAINAAILAVDPTDAVVDHPDAESESPYDPWGLAAKYERDRRKGLVVAAALLIAEIERIDRATARGER